MKLSQITFTEESKEDVLELFGKTTDKEGYLVEMENLNHCC